MNSNKERLILDIQNLLNSHGTIKKSSINPELLEFMDEATLKSIIESILSQKENSADIEWLQQFKASV